MKNNFGFKILALFLAVLLWLYVTNQQNPLAENTFTVPIEVKSLPTKLVVADKTPSVTVRLTARKQVLDKISSRDVHAYLNLQDAKMGANKMDIEVSVPKDIQVVSVSPLQGDIILTKVSSKQIALKIKTINPPPTGYVILAQQLTPSEVVISGPLNILEKAVNAVVVIDLSAQKANYMSRLPVRLFDEQNNDISDWVNVKPDIAETFIAIAPNQPRKQVAVKPVFTGTLPGTKKIALVLTEPQLVTLTGSDRLLSSLFVAETTPIDLSDKKDSFTTEVFLKLPQGISAYPVDKVHVTVKISE